MEIKGLIKVDALAASVMFSQIRSKAIQSGLSAEYINGKVIVHIPDPFNLRNLIKKPWVLLSPALVHFEAFRVSKVEAGLEYSIKIRIGRMYLTLTFVNLLLIIFRVKYSSNELFSIISIFLINAIILAFFFASVLLDWRIFKKQFFNLHRR